MGAEALVRAWQHRFGLDDLDVGIEWVAAPGGKDDALGHVEPDPDLRHFTLELCSSGLEGEELELTVIHELLHIAQRHIIAYGRAALGEQFSILETAIEEDTEALAEAVLKLHMGSWEEMAVPDGH